MLRQPAGARLLERHHRPVLVPVAVGDGADQPIAPDVAARQRHHGELGIIDPQTDRLIGKIPIGIRPVEILMNKTGQTLFVFESRGNVIQVIDARKSKLLHVWPVSSQRPGDGAFDEANHRLFIGTRNPASMVVMDSTNGKEVASLPTVEGMDGVYFDVST